MIAILVPLYERVYHLPRLSQNLKDVSPDAVIYLRAIPNITPTYRVESNMKQVLSHTTRYAEGINLLAKEAINDGAEWLFIGADDLDFKGGWFDAARGAAETQQAQVIGTNDLCNPKVIAGQHATHFLVHPDFFHEGSWDGPETLMSEEYKHSFVDNEIIITAMDRSVYAHASHSYVEHLHPIGGKTEWDSTYERGSGGGNLAEDEATFKDRVERYATGTFA